MHAGRLRCAGRSDSHAGEHGDELLERKRVSRAFVYSPRVQREEFVHHVSHQIVAGLVSEFGQAAVAQFVDVLDELDPAALETLRQAIQERQGSTQ